VTTDDVEIRALAWLASSNRRRTPRGFPLMRAMQAFVSSR
jgi:hypothetical protein